MTTANESFVCKPTIASDKANIDDSRDGYRDEVVMDSTGVVDYPSANYVEDDDVMDSIAEGYF